MIIVDKKIRKCEEEYLKSLGYNIWKVENSNNVYDEISSHADIFFTKLNDKIVVEPTFYDKLNSCYDKCIKGNSILREEYPFDIAYNVCQIGRNVIHNFKYTDKKVMEIIKDEKLNMININQGYSNCSIAVIDENSAIVTDKKISDILKKNNIDVLLIEDKIDIKLLKNNNEYSNMSGFIGGCIARLDDKIIIFGDRKYIDRNNKIEEFVKRRKLKLVDFKNIPVIDYGGIVSI